MGSVLCVPVPQSPVLIPVRLDQNRPCDLIVPQSSLKDPTEMGGGQDISTRTWEHSSAHDSDLPGEYLQVILGAFSRCFPGSLILEFLSLQCGLP
jgi:hypothetical protein